MLRRRRLVRSTTLIAASIVLAACRSSTGVVSAADWKELARAESRWKDRPFADYSYEIRTLCYCPPIIVQWIRVTVHGGVVVDAALVEPDPSFEIPTLSYWQPIDTIFADLRRRLAHPSLAEAYAEFEAEYDPTLGYPTRIEFREREGVSDAESVSDLRNMTPLP